MAEPARALPGDEHAEEAPSASTTGTWTRAQVLEGPTFHGLAARDDSRQHNGDDNRGNVTNLVTVNYNCNLHHDESCMQSLLVCSPP